MPCHNLFCKTNTSRWLQHISETLHKCVLDVAVQTPMGWNVKIVKTVLSSQQRASRSRPGEDETIAVCEEGKVQIKRQHT